MIVLRSFKEGEAVGFKVPARLDEVVMADLGFFHKLGLWARGHGTVDVLPGEPPGRRWQWLLPPWRLFVPTSMTDVAVATANRASGAWITLPPDYDEAAGTARLMAVFGAGWKVPIQFVPWYFARLADGDLRRTTFVLFFLWPVLRLWCLVRSLRGRS